MAARKTKPSTVSRSLLWSGARSALAVLAVVLAFPASAEDDEASALAERELESADGALFSIDSPIGPFEYTLGRGLRVGHTGLHVGGFTTAEFDREQGEPGILALDSVNLLVLLEPNEYIRGFAEIEIGDLFTWETNRESTEGGASAVIERVYGDLRVGDPFNVRVGKFQTPVGRYNLIPAEPFVWSALDPILVEVTFEEHTTGGAFLGSLPMQSGSLDYWVFGQFIDPLDPSEDPRASDHSAGGRLQWSDFRGAVDEWSIGSSFMATEINGEWSYLGGLDWELRWHHLLLTSELTIQQGELEDRELWDLYLQGVYEVVPTFNLVARYEHIDLSGRSEDAHLGDVGVAWIPKSYLHLKATYRFTDKQTEEARRGLAMSFSFIF